MLSHKKIDLQKRLRFEEYDDPLGLGSRSRSTFSSRDSRWINLEFGEFNGRSLPWVVFHNPGYFLSILATVRPSDPHRKTILWQAKEVLHLATHILPPGRGAKEFVAFMNRKEQLRQIALCKKGHTPKPGNSRWMEVYRSQYLDIRLLNGSSNGPRASERLGAFMRDTFFDRPPTDLDCEAFFDDRSNFGRFKQLH